MKILTLLFICTFLFARELIQPIPQKLNYDAKKAELGKYLFFDPLLSINNTISCASCHKANEGWADSRAVSIGVYERKGKLNSPTVLNAVFNFRQFWNGEVKTLQEQAKIPLENHYEMAMNKDEMQKRLNGSQFYKKRFKEVYKDDYITLANMLDTIAEYEKTLITPNSKFDLYLTSKAKLSKDEREGYTIFKKFGCITCHNGINVGGNSFQKMGMIYPVKDCTGDRYEITKNKFDKCVYKVPTLRNIELTAPYFHNAEAKTLKKAVEMMAYHNLGIVIDENDTEKIISFLKTLSGKLPYEQEGKK